MKCEGSGSLRHCGWWQIPCLAGLCHAKSSPYPHSPQPQAPPLVGGIAGELHGPGALPCLGAPDRSSCAGLGEGRKSVPRHSQAVQGRRPVRQSWILKGPILATRWQCTPRECSRGHPAFTWRTSSPRWGPHQVDSGEQASLPDSGILCTWWPGMVRKLAASLYKSRQKRAVRNPGAKGVTGSGSWSLLSWHPCALMSVCEILSPGSTGKGKGLRRMG